MTANRHTGVIIGEKRRQAFLNILSRTGKVAYSARKAGYADSSSLHRARVKDEEFARKWDEAVNAAADMLEDEAIRRGSEGVRKAVRHKGVVVGYELVYSDQLLMFMLKGVRGDKFADRSKHDTTINANIGIALMPAVEASVGAWQQQAAKIHQKQDAERITVESVATLISEEIIEPEYADIRP